ncbi:MAG: VWA domain-containing protein, partial [Tidjanibacter sp.]|nr:VWA domain-containing protein [Tidjanibacter sp.]
VIDDGTAIGNGLATAINRLKDSEAKSKVAILLTDGVNNSGQIAPLTAAEIAKGYGIKVYTIGVGTRGMAPYPVYDMWGRLHFQQMEVDIDEQVLTDIADLTGGQYFRATNRQTLAAIYDEINALEKTKIETDEFVKYNELYRGWLIGALLLLIGEVLVRKLVLKQIP